MLLLRTLLSAERAERRGTTLNVEQVTWTEPPCSPARAWPSTHHRWGFSCPPWRDITETLWAAVIKQFIKTTNQSTPTVPLPLEMKGKGSALHPPPPQTSILSNSPINKTQKRNLSAVKLLEQTSATHFLLWKTGKGKSVSWEVLFSVGYQTVRYLFQLPAFCVYTYVNRTVKKRAQW